MELPPKLQEKNMDVGAEEGGEGGVLWDQVRVPTVLSPLDSLCRGGLALAVKLLTCCRFACRRRTCSPACVSEGGLEVAI